MGIKEQIGGCCVNVWCLRLEILASGAATGNWQSGSLEGKRGMRQARQVELHTLYNEMGKLDIDKKARRRVT